VSPADHGLTGGAIPGELGVLEGVEPGLEDAVGRGGEDRDEVDGLGGHGAILSIRVERDDSLHAVAAGENDAGVVRDVVRHGVDASGADLRDGERASAGGAGGGVEAVRAGEVEVERSGVDAGSSRAEEVEEPDGAGVVVGEAARSDVSGFAVNGDANGRADRGEVELVVVLCGRRRGWRRRRGRAPGEEDAGEVGSHGARG
jgi:hypothetical protein